MKPLIRDFSLIGAAALLFAGTVAHQFDFYKDWNQGSGKFIQRVNIPSEEAIKIMALGYDNAYANVMTLTAIQNFGAAWDTEAKVVEPIYNYFDVLTQLDPNFVEVYELGNLVLSDTYGERENNKGHYLSIDLMRKGNYNNPSVWKIPYLAMYTSVWGLNDDNLAKSFLPILRRIPKTPDYVLRMEEYIERQSGRYHIAFDINLEHYLSYIDQQKEAEENVARMKLATILDGWYKTQIATVASQYYEDNGRHPLAIEELISGPYMIEFEAPTAKLIEDSINAHYNESGSLLEKKELIRSESTRTIKGLPPEPNGTWYYINSFTANQFNQRPEDFSQKLLDRFSYIVPVKDVLDRNNVTSIRAQSFIFDYINTNTIAPTAEEMKSYLIPDGMGGHYVYFTDVAGSDGRVLPRFYSTAMIRFDDNNPNKDPRIGLSGTLDQFPARSFQIPDMPDYLTAEPSIWDFEEDAVWAICKGFVPGVRLHYQTELLSEMVDPLMPYLPCDDHIILPDMMK